jgi:hypothetical protein
MNESLRDSAVELRLASRLLRERNEGLRARAARLRSTSQALRKKRLGVSGKTEGGLLKPLGSSE